MRLTRVHVATPLTGGAVLELPDSAGAHLVRVLRLGVGAALAVFDGRGAEYGAVIARVRGTRVDVELTERRAGAAESRLALTLLQSISRAERMDWTIQKATELGVSRIVPLKTLPCQESVMTFAAPAQLPSPSSMSTISASSSSSGLYLRRYSDRRPCS